MRVKAMRMPHARSKYGALPTMVDGIKFHSKAEARRYGALRLLERAGEITGLVLQPSFTLTVAEQPIGRYLADFSYYKPDGEFIVEDVKGMAGGTPTYRLKKRIVQAMYGIQIQEVR